MHAGQALYSKIILEYLSESPWSIFLNLPASGVFFSESGVFFCLEAVKNGVEFSGDWRVGVGDLTKHTEPPGLFDTFKLGRAIVCTAHVIERCTTPGISSYIYICTPLPAPYAL